MSMLYSLRKASARKRADTSQDVAINANARAQLSGYSFPAGSLYDFGNRKVCPIWLLMVQEGGSDEGLVGDLDVYSSIAHV